MKGKLRVVAVLLVCFLVFSLTACSLGQSGKSPDQSQKETTAQTAGGKIKLTWMSWGHSRPQEIRNEALMSAFPELAAKYEIEPIVGGNDVGTVIEKIRLALASKTNLPDIFQTSSMFFPEMADSGVLADLSSIYKDVESQLLDGIKDLVTYKGVQYAFPYCINTLVWIYRTDMFNEAGIDISSVKNIDDFITAGKKLQEKFPDSYIHAGNATDFAGYFYWCAPGNGTQIVDSKGNYIFKDDPNAKKLLQDIKKLYDSDVVYDVASWTPDWEQGFASSKIASYLTCNWFKDAAFLPKYAPETAGKWGVTVWPEIGGGIGGSENGGAMIMVFDQSPNKDAAIEVLTKLCFTNEGNLAMYESSDNSLTPVMKEAYDDPSVAAGDSFFGNAFWRGELESVKLYKALEYTPAASLEMKILNPYIEKYLNNEMSLEQALEGATKDMKTQIGNPFELTN